MNKIQARQRRGVKTKAIIRQSKRPRLIVHRSAAHLYSQIVITGDQGDVVLVTASTLDKELKPKLKGKKVDHAIQVGQLLGQRAKEKSITDVAFDRAGYKYHGRIKALADGARKAGLNF
ncbi:MAG: 50S ribosomal protein L18 [Legionellales bacterium]|nr:50S ribosomal protein L18 [Legionellales bacterium]